MTTTNVTREASSGNACPLCGHDHYCFIIGDPPQKVICQWTDANRPPTGWNYLGLARDNRPIFATTDRKRSTASKYPELIKLIPDQKQVPQWVTVQPPATLSPGDVVLHRPSKGKPGNLYEFKKRTSKGKVLVTEVGAETLGKMEVPEKQLEYGTNDDATGAELVSIEYLYPDPVTQEPFGKVVRAQWSDRRPWMYEGRGRKRKTKSVRPYHWDKKQEKFLIGRGDRAWPLYRETEAKDAIVKGGIVFAVAGEQAVEVYRSLGLVAVSGQGGEARYQDIADRLADAFDMARVNEQKPLLVIHPDFDLTGEQKFGEGLRVACRKANIQAVVMRPEQIWGQIGHGHDIKDIVEHSGLNDQALLRALETAIDSGIDSVEKEDMLRKQRLRWGAPDSYQGELGYWYEQGAGCDARSVFKPLTNFDLQIEKEVASQDGGGFILQLKRSGEHQQYRVFLPALEFTSVQNFENTLKRALGGVLICRLNVNQMKALLRVRLHEYTHNRGGKVYKLADRVGQQADGYWVFPQPQFTPTGEATDENKSLWLWNTTLTGDESTLPSPHIAPTSSTALKTLIHAMEAFFGPINIKPALLTLGYAAAAVHFQTFIEREGAFNILNLIGDGGSGKTTAGMCALAMVGMHTEAASGMLKDVSVSAAYEHLKITGSLLHCLDDPERKPELDEFLKGLYNGKARLVRGSNGGSFNMQRPHSPMMVTSNFAAGETNAATMSRLIPLWFDSNDTFAGEAMGDLMKSWDQASGCLPQLIGIPYDIEAIRAIEQQLRPWLDRAHSRILRGLSVLVYYTEQVFAVSGDLLISGRHDIRGYVMHDICPTLNDGESTTDSLKDFVERLFVLRSQAKVGEWNMRLIQDQFGFTKALAINLPSAWATMDREFTLAYNLKIIKHLLKGKGATLSSLQKFHADEDVSRAFKRKATNDPDWKVKRCVEIPIALIKDYVDAHDESPENCKPCKPDSKKSPETPSTIDSSQLTVLKNNCKPTVNGVNEGTDGVVNKSESGLHQASKTVNAQNPYQQSGVEGQLTELTQLTQKMDADLNPPSQTVNDDASDHREEPLPVVNKGDLVIPSAITLWHRKGSHALPKGSIPIAWRHEPTIPLSELSVDALNAIQAPSLVLSISRDGQRAKVRNQETGSTSVLGLRGLNVMPKS